MDTHTTYTYYKELLGSVLFICCETQLLPKGNSFWVNGELKETETVWWAPLKKMIGLQIVLIHQHENTYEMYSSWSLLAFHTALSAMLGTKFLRFGVYLLYSDLFWLGCLAQICTDKSDAFYAVVYVNFEETANPLMSSDLIFFRPLEHSSIKNLWDWWMLWEWD